MKRLATAAALAAIVLPAVATGHPGHDVHYCPKGDQSGFEAERLIGLNVGKAAKVSARHECEFRVVKQNGEWLGINDDLRTWRINVVVFAGQVKRINGIY